MLDPLDFANQFRLILFAIRLPRTFLKTALICASFRTCSATRTLARPIAIHMSQGVVSRQPLRIFTHGRESQLTRCAIFILADARLKKRRLRQSGCYADFPHKPRRFAGPLSAPPPLPRGPTETLQISRFAPYRMLALGRAKHCSFVSRCGSAVSQRARAASLAHFVRVAPQNHYTV